MTDPKIRISIVEIKTKEKSEKTQVSTEADICAFFHLCEQGNRIEDIGGSMGTEKQEELLQIKNLAISFYN